MEENSSRTKSRYNKFAAEVSSDSSSVSSISSIVSSSASTIPLPTSTNHPTSSSAQAQVVTFAIPIPPQETPPPAMQNISSTTPPPPPMPRLTPAPNINPVSAPTNNTVPVQTSPTPPIFPTGNIMYNYTATRTTTFIPHANRSWRGKGYKPRNIDYFNNRKMNHHYHQDNHPQFENSPFARKHFPPRVPRFNAPLHRNPIFPIRHRIRVISDPIIRPPTTANYFQQQFNMQASPNEAIRNLLSQCKVSLPSGVDSFGIVQYLVRQGLHIEFRIGKLVALDMNVFLHNQSRLWRCEIDFNECVSISDSSNKNVAIEAASNHCLMNLARMFGAECPIFPLFNKDLLIPRGIVAWVNDFTRSIDYDWRRETSAIEQGAGTGLIEFKTTFKIAGNVFCGVHRVRKYTLPIACKKVFRHFTNENLADIDYFVGTERDKSRQYCFTSIDVTSYIMEDDQCILEDMESFEKTFTRSLTLKNWISTIKTQRTTKNHHRDFPNF